MISTILWTYALFQLMPFPPPLLIKLLPYSYSSNLYFTRVTPQEQDKKTIAIRQLLVQITSIDSG